MNHINFLTGIRLSKELVNILLSENENNWIKSINAIVRELESHNIENAASIYDTINAGNGSFSDFHIWRNDFDERVKENEKLDRIKRELEDFLNQTESKG